MGPARVLIGVGAVIVDEGRLLMVQRGKEPYRGKWTIPGGTLEDGEYLADACQREVREETGLRVEVGDLLGVLELEWEPRYVMLDYLATVVGSKEPARGSDAADVRWVPLKEVVGLKCTPHFVRTLRGWGVLADEQRD